jgi:thymidylate kinase-like protein
VTRSQIVTSSQSTIASRQHWHPTANRLFYLALGHALACLYAADRYHHVETEIRPRIEAGAIVITDRYIPSGLVIQRFDGVDPELAGHILNQLTFFTPPDRPEPVLNDRVAP